MKAFVVMCGRTPVAVRETAEAAAEFVKQVFVKDHTGGEFPINWDHSRNALHIVPVGQ